MAEIGVAVEIGLHLNKIGAARNQRVNIFSGLFGIGDDQRWLKKRGLAIEIRPGKENSRSLQLAALYFMAERNERF